MIPSKESNYEDSRKSGMPDGMLFFFDFVEFCKQKL